MPSILHIDFETRSELDLRKVGLHRYARHPSTAVWCMAWAFSNNEPEIWTPARNPLDSAGWGINGGSQLEDVHVYAHNAPFELEIWNEIMVKRYGWPALRPEQTYCTLAMTYAMGLPGNLEDAALALGLEMQKDIEGRALMLRYARPWKAGKWMDECPLFTIGGQQLTGAQGLKRLYEYCKQDVRTERELHSKLMPLSARERKVWLLDYKINQRGVAVDVEAAKAAVKLADTMKERYDQEMSNVTNGAATTCTALGPIKDFLAAHGCPEAQGGLAKQDVVDLLERTDLDSRVRKVLTLRQEAGKASAAKFDVMVDRAGDDGRIRGMYQYHGAGTGRWAARGVQPHNLVRDMRKADEVEKVIQLVKEGKHDAIDLLFGPPLSELTRCLRSFFVAPPGKTLISGDFANVEGRGQAWFAGEQWKLDAFKAADEKRGPGLYELMYSRCFNVPAESIKDPSEERQVGKVLELAFGYQGGIGSGKTMGKTYGVKATDEQFDQWKDLWRDAHPMIAGVRTISQRTGRMYRKGGVWNGIQQAAIAAVLNPGTSHSCGHPARMAIFKMVGSFLWCLLPSQRVICFPYPKVLAGEYSQQLTYMTVPGQDRSDVIFDEANSNNWARVSTYGGALFNRIVQGFCRDLLADCMLALDEKGAQIVLHTHDDINIEIDTLKGIEARTVVEQMMRTTAPWAKDFPLFAKCKLMRRYGK